MVEFGKNCLVGHIAYRLSKLVVFRQIGSIQANWLYSGKLVLVGHIALSNFCIRANWLYLGRGGCIRANWLYLGKIGVIRANWLYSGRSGCIRAKRL